MLSTPNVVIPESAQRLSGTQNLTSKPTAHGVKRRGWVPDKAFGLSGMTTLDWSSGDA